jgi:hypothetical protein
MSNPKLSHQLCVAAVLIQRLEEVALPDEGPMTTLERLIALSIMQATPPLTIPAPPPSTTPVIRRMSSDPPPDVIRKTIVVGGQRDPLKPNTRTYGGRL